MLIKKNIIITRERVSFVMLTDYFYQFTRFSCRRRKNGRNPEKGKTFISEEVVTNCVVFICHNSEKWNQDKSREMERQKKLDHLSCIFVRKLQASLTTCRVCANFWLTLERWGRSDRASKKAAVKNFNFPACLSQTLIFHECDH